MENSEDPDQLASSADLDLYCFQKRVQLFEKRKVYA